MEVTLSDKCFLCIKLVNIHNRSSVVEANPRIKIARLLENPNNQAFFGSVGKQMKKDKTIKLSKKTSRKKYFKVTYSFVESLFFLEIRSCFRAGRTFSICRNTITPFCLISRKASGMERLLVVGWRSRAGTQWVHILGGYRLKLYR